MKFHKAVLLAFLLLPVVAVSDTAQKISPGEAASHLSNRVDPVYPQMAKTAHIQGSVILRITITADGIVTEITVISGHPILVQAALDAVRQWRYRPFLVENKPAAVQTMVTVPFSLEGPSSVTGNKVSAEEATSHLREQVAPVYPQTAKAVHIQGSVVLRITITEDGTVTGMTIVSGHPLLIQAAMDAVKEWHYRPFLVENKPTAVQTTVTVPFYYGNAPLGAVNKISAEDAASHLRDGAAPVVPQMAKVAHIQGSVVLRITITEEGTVTGVNVVSGHPILIQAAIDAVTKWRYKPFLVENKPAAVQTIVTVPFILDTAK